MNLKLTKDQKANRKNYKVEMQCHGKVPKLRKNEKQKKRMYYKIAPTVAATVACDAADVGELLAAEERVEWRAGGAWLACRGSGRGAGSGGAAWRAAWRHGEASDVLLRRPAPRKKANSGELLRVLRDSKRENKNMKLERETRQI